VVVARSDGTNVLVSRGARPAGGGRGRGGFGPWRRRTAPSKRSRPGAGDLPRCAHLAGAPGSV